MNKVMKLLASAALAFSLVGCGSSAANNDEEQARKVADDFWTALEKGDPDTARTYVVGDAKDSLDSMLSGIESVTTSFGDEDVSGMEDKFKALITSIVSLTFKDHTIDAVTKDSDTAYTVKSTVNLVDDNTMDSFTESEEYNKFMSDLITEVMEYSESHTEEETTQLMIGKILDFMTTGFDSIKETASYSPNTATLKIEKQEDAWVITEFTPESSETKE